MGWFDDMARKTRRRAQREAARYAARKARDGARRALDVVTEGLFGRTAPEPEPPLEPDEEARRARELEEREARRRARDEREQQAREDLDRLKREAWAQRERMGVEPDGPAAQTSAEGPAASADPGRDRGSGPE